MSVQAVAEPGPQHNVQASRQAYYDKAAKFHMTPLWEVLKGLVTPEPKTQCVPAIWKFPDVKRLMLEAGDVISCGVNHQGLGPIQDGETVVMEIEQVGRLSVQVQDPHKRKWPKGIDHEMAAWVKDSIAGKRVPLPSIFKGRKGYGE